MTIGYEALRHTVAAHRIDRDALRISGPDAVSYLQGQCSQDIASLAEGEAADALLLSPQGKIDALVRCTRIGEDAFVVDTDGGFGDVVKARLERFRLRVKVVIEALAWQCVAVRGPDAGASGLVSGAIAADLEVLHLPVSWPGFSGFDLLGPISATGPIGEDAGAWVVGGMVRCGHDAFEAVRIEAGCPINGREITEATIAAEVGLVDRTVSFTKGCFTGQELVARLDSRGSKVARKLAGLVIAGIDPSAGEFPPAGAAVWGADGEHEVGKVTSVAWSPQFGAPVALAVLHRRVVPPESVVVRWGDGSGDGGPGHEAIAEARPLPLVE